MRCTRPLTPSEAWLGHWQLEGPSAGERRKNWPTQTCLQEEPCNYITTKDTICQPRFESICEYWHIRSSRGGADLVHLNHVVTHIKGILLFEHRPPPPWRTSKPIWPSCEALGKQNVATDAFFAADIGRKLKGKQRRKQRTNKRSWLSSELGFCRTLFFNSVNPSKTNEIYKEDQPGAATAFCGACGNDFLLEDRVTWENERREKKVL